MRINREDLLKGKATIIKNKSFGSTKSYVDPFFKLMDPLDPEYEIDVIPPSQLTVIGEDTDVTYNRVYIKAILNEDHSIKIEINDKTEIFDKVIGMIYGLDVKVPIIKFYKGFIRRNDSSLFALSEYLNIQEINDEDILDYEVITNWEENDEYKSALSRLIHTKINRSQKEALVGKWIHKSLTEEYLSGFSKTKLTKSSIVDVYRNTFIDESSDYFVGYEEEIDKHSIYFAFGELIKNEKDILNKFEKTLIVNRILEVN